jgi:transcriptional regulator with XRE-family HTH domain
MGVEVQRVLEFLRLLDLSQAELARRIGESPQTVSNWMRRGAIPGRKLPKVARALGPGVTVEELLDYEPRGAEEKTGAYDVETMHLLRAMESGSPRERAHLKWALRRLLNRPS